MLSLLRAALVPCCLFAVACSSSTTDPVDTQAPAAHQSHAHTHASTKAQRAGAPRSKIEHVVVIVQENHSFDSYFGGYCTAPTGSNPTCTDGPSCCEAGPALDPAGRSPVTLDDAMSLSYDPRHDRGCETLEMNGGAMDHFSAPNDFIAGDPCGDPWNFAYASPSVVKPYRALAERYALADRYFQPVIGASSSNDMYLARAHYVFTDNDLRPAAIGSACGGARDEQLTSLLDPTIGDLLSYAGVSWKFYAEGYDRMATSEAVGLCPPAPADCPSDTSAYPCGYDPSDNPFTYYARSGDDSGHLEDMARLHDDLAAGTLPAVTFVKPLGYRSEHPGSTISLGVSFVTDLVAEIDASAQGDSTLILLTWDESGGYFDHVKPPKTNAADGQPYGPRIPLLAIGPFARTSTVSHVEMEHSSIVKFIEWNWLGGTTGQLGARDASVNGIGSLLDPDATGTPVPED